MLENGPSDDSVTADEAVPETPNVFAVSFREQFFGFGKAAKSLG
jgi:hypothetical protein